MSPIERRTRRLAEHALDAASKPIVVEVSRHTRPRQAALDRVQVALLASIEELLMVRAQQMALLGAGRRRRHHYGLLQQRS